MKLKMVIQGDIRELFAPFEPPTEMRGYAVSVIMNELRWMVNRASKNKSRQCKDGSLIVEVTREVLPKSHCDSRPEWAK